MISVREVLERQLMKGHRVLAGARDVLTGRGVNFDANSCL
jgi:hypothetical protein